MKCDSSHHYMKENKMIAFGNIKINKGDSLFISGKKLIYDGNNSIAHLNGGVFLKDKHTKLNTEEITFNLEDNIAYYPKKGKITDKNITLTSDKGRYNTNTHLFYFKKNVVVKSDNYTVETDTLNYNSESKTTYFIGPSFIVSENNTIYCENGWYNTFSNLSQFNENAYISNGEHLIKGDSLFYNRNIGYGKALGNISMIDSNNNKTIVNLAEYFEKEEKIEVTKKALLNIIFEEDTLFMTANKFINFSGTKEYILAYNNVKIFKEDFQGKCDSLYYSISDSVVKLFKTPILWVDKMQITSDSINILLKNQKIDRMNFYPNPLIVSEAEISPYHFKTRRVNIDFTEPKGKKKVKTFKLKGFLIEDDKRVSQRHESRVFERFVHPMAMDHLTSVHNAFFQYLLGNTEEDKFLENFIWRISEKPKSKEDILRN